MPSPEHRCRIGLFHKLASCRNLPEGLGLKLRPEHVVQAGTMQPWLKHYPKYLFYHP